MERQELIDRIAAVLRDDERIRAAWLAGSLGRGVGDEFSDVDVWAVCAASDLDGVVAELSDLAARSAPTVLNQRVGELPVCHAITPDWLRFDIAVGTVDDVASRSRTEVRELFDKDGLAVRLPEDSSPAVADPTAIERLITEFFRTLGLLPVVLGREEFALAQSGAGRLRDLLIALLREESGATNVGALRLAPFLPAERLAMLDRLPPMDATRDSAIAVHLACAQAFLPIAREVADRSGADWPTALHEACAHHWERRLGVGLPAP